MFCLSSSLVLALRFSGCHIRTSADGGLTNAELVKTTGRWSVSPRRVSAGLYQNRRTWTSVPMIPSSSDDLAPCQNTSTVQLRKIKTSATSIEPHQENADTKNARPWCQNRRSTAPSNRQGRVSCEFMRHSFFGKHPDSTASAGKRVGPTTMFTCHRDRKLSRDGRESCVSYRYLRHLVHDSIQRLTSFTLS